MGSTGVYEQGTDKCWLGGKLPQRKQFLSIVWGVPVRKGGEAKGRYNILGRRRSMCKNHGGSKEQGMLQVFSISTVSVR